MTISSRRGMPGTRIWAPRKMPFEHEKPEDLAQRLVTDREHEKADQLHRQHHGQRQHRDRPAEIEGRADAVGDGQREDDREGPDDQRRADLQDDEHLPVHHHPANDSRIR